ncbi:MAG: PEP-CTERM sorting domain-containing protein [Alphaproteobacteria bacterium]|nr:PEP-CTERM sorting domain-containing protein [Alphaproteobacteria bacterium]
MFNYDGVNYNRFINNSHFSTSDKTWGYILFDKSLLNATGTGSIVSNSFGRSDFTAWEFQDGFNVFNNLVTTRSYTIQVSFTNFAPSSWFIDATHGHTFSADIFSRGDISSNSDTSYYRGSRAYATNNTGQRWSRVSSVPEPEMLSLFIGGLGLMGFVVRRRKKIASPN